MILDTHKEIEHLKELGATQKLAEGIVQLHTKSDDHLSTKADLVATKVDLKTDITRLESKIDTIEIKLESKIDTIVSGLNSNIRDLTKDINWLKTISIANFTLLLGAVISTLFSK
jgi:hypothetical protein